MSATDVEPAHLELVQGERGVPDWLPFALEQTVSWMTVDYAEADTTRAYAVDLGVPRAMQLWRPPPKGNRGRRSPGPLPQSFLRWCASFDVNPFVDLDTDLAKAWARFARGCGDAHTTIRRRVGAVGAWYAAMRRRGHTAIVFADLLTTQDRRNLHIHTGDPATPTVAATLEQVRALQVAAALDPGPHRARNRVIAALLPATGLRAAELCGLDVEDLHRRGPGGYPALYVRGKGGRFRWVRVPAAELALLEAYLPVRVAPTTGTDLTRPDRVGNRPAAEQPLLTSTHGNRLSPQSITHTITRLTTVPDPAGAVPAVAVAARVLAEAGSLHPHRFRHFHAQDAEAGGAALSRIRAQLGHRSISTTQRYLDSGADLSTATSVLVSELIHTGADLDSLTAP